MRQDLYSPLALDQVGSAETGKEFSTRLGISHAACSHAFWGHVTVGCPSFPELSERGSGKRTYKSQSPPVMLQRLLEVK